MMYVRNSILAKQRGFTLVELLIVIAVIAILAGLTVAGYGAWRTSVAETEVRSDLSSVQSAMEDARNFGENGYVTAPSFSGASALYASSQGVSLQYAYGDERTYCINGTSTERSSVQFYIASNVSEPQEGTCGDWSPPEAPGGDGEAPGGGGGIGGGVDGGSDAPCPDVYDPVAARNIQSGEIREFSNSCRVPSGWEIIGSGGTVDR